MHRSPHRARPARAAVLAAGVACLAAPTAMADSIVYVDRGDVWSSQPDGSGKVQLTDGGDWHSPTQADDGTIAAVQGTGPIQVMARDGRPLRTITTPPARSGDGGTFSPAPKDLSFSPDGTKIAYAYVAYSYPVASSCGTIQRSTFYTAADVTEATPHGVYGNQFGVSDPEWVTNTRTLVFGGYGSQVAIDDLGPGDYSQKAWMVPDADMGDGEVSRDGRRLATTFDYGDDMLIAFFAVKGDVKTETPPEYPDAACNTSDGDARHGDPSWSPDGTSVAYESSRGIEIVRFTKLDASGCETAGESAILTPTGSSPDWGPAEPPAARWVPEGDGEQPGGGGGQSGGGDKTPIEGDGRALALQSSQSTLRALRRGLVVRVVAPGPGRVTVELTAGRRTIASGSARARRAGTVKVRLSKVRRAKAARLAGRKLEITARHAGTPGRVTKTLRLR